MRKGREAVDRVILDHDAVMQIRDALREGLAASDIPVQQLAGELGVSPRTLRRWTQPKGPLPSLAQLSLLCRRIGAWQVGSILFGPPPAERELQELIGILMQHNRFWADYLRRRAGPAGR